MAIWIGSNIIIARIHCIMINNYMIVYCKLSTFCLPSIEIFILFFDLVATFWNSKEKRTREFKKGTWIKLFQWIKTIDTPIGSKTAPLNYTVRYRDQRSIHKPWIWTTSSFDLFGVLLYFCFSCWFSRLIRIRLAMHGV